jgi:hypothetical protein
MKKAIKVAAFAALSVGIAGEAFAQAATQDVNITATVNPTCLISGLATGAALANPVTVSSAGYVSTTTTTHTVNSVVCNVAADVLTTTINGAVTNPNPAAAGFQNTFDYTATAAFGGATSNIDTSTVAAGGTGSTANTGGARSGNLVIGVTPTTNTNPLVSGSYSDTLRVTLTPTP